MKLNSLIFLMLPPLKVSSVLWLFTFCIVATVVLNCWLCVTEQFIISKPFLLCLPISRMPLLYQPLCGDNSAEFLRIELTLDVQLKCFVESEQRVLGHPTKLRPTVAMFTITITTIISIIPTNMIIIITINFVNLSISALGIFSNSCTTFLEMCHSLSIEPIHRRFLISKLSTIAIRTSYYIICCIYQT